MGAEAPTHRGGEAEGFCEVDFIDAPRAEAGRLEIEVPEFLTDEFIDELLGDHPVPCPACSSAGAGACPRRISASE